jgi:hypothetical protein
MEYLTMTKKEINRCGIIKRLIDKEINGTYASELLNLSVRQVKRLKARVKECGAKGLIHASRGRPGNRKMPDKEKERMIALLHKHYSDFKPGFAAEKLEERHNIKRDPKTVRSIMIKENLWKPKKKKCPDYHAWRQRKASYGEMLQFDGSYHHWFENRGPHCCLLAAIDDATGIPVKAMFDYDEGVIPVFSFWKEYTQQHGKPRLIYLDKFSTYKMNQKTAMDNPDTLTQFQRAMRQLGIEPIPANSPQAKGRIERLFNTFQDRLIKEMRLADISTIKEANIFLEKEFLPKYKEKYGVEPRVKANLHQPLTLKEKNNLSSIFSRQSVRVIRNDFTIALNKQLYQLLKDQPVTIQKKDKIIIEEWTDKSMRLTLKGRYLNFKTITERPKRIKKTDWIIPANQKVYVPAPDHPWRKEMKATWQKKYQTAQI